MKWQKLSVFRLALALVIMAGMAWLHWWVFPPMGIFRTVKDCLDEPVNGYSLASCENGKCQNLCALQMVRIGLPVLWEAWPYVFAGLLCGSVIGYPMGELARRKFAVERVSAAALRECEAKLASASGKEQRAEWTLSAGQKFLSEASNMEAKLSQERLEIRTIKQEAEEHMQRGEAMIRKAAAVEKELANAKAKIRRLTEKAGRRRKKPIDIAPYPY